MDLWDVAVAEGDELGGVLVGVVGEGEGMAGTLAHVEGFGFRLGSIEVIDHGSGHEIVAVAMNEEHGQAALAHLLEHRSLSKSPAILHLGDQTCHMEQGE